MDKNPSQLRRHLSFLRLQLDHVPTQELLLAVRQWIEVSLLYQLSLTWEFMFALGMYWNCLWGKDALGILEGWYSPLQVINIVVLLWGIKWWRECNWDFPLSEQSKPFNLALLSEPTKSRVRLHTGWVTVLVCKLYSHAKLLKTGGCNNIIEGVSY